MVRMMLTLYLLINTVEGNMYDVFMPAYKSSCKNGCAAWASAGRGNATMQNIIDAMFADGTVPDEAGSDCAMPAAHAGDNECDCGQKDGETYIFDSYEGPWCFCADPAANENTTAYCSPPQHVPEQINLQLAASDVVVVGFVTYETENATNPATAMFGNSKDSMEQITGVSHWYAPPGRTGDTPFTPPYTMHYVKFSVEERTQYYYKVKSGAAEGVWSDVFEFRSGYSSGITRVLTYGDLGHSHFNAMGNVRDDCQSGKIDAVVHMGDHAYNIGFSSGRRGDAYMNAWQEALTTCPWFPIIGNHEASDGDHFRRYEAIAWGEAYGLNSTTGVGDDRKKSLSEVLANGGAAAPSSSATTPLGLHLTTATLYGMGMHGTLPSNTSRYASTDLGLIHMVGLDLNDLDPAQLSWLDADLARAHANRNATPWIMVMSHFPIFHSQTQQFANMSLEHFLGDENMANYSADVEGMDFVPCEEEGCKTIGEWRLGLAEALQPLFMKYGVDIYNAGHVHSYESTYPICDFTTGEICDGKQDYDEPKGPVHITDGNGGVPGCRAQDTIMNCSKPGGFCRVRSSGGGAHGRITAFNASHLLYEHVQNNGSQVTDSFLMVQHSHGPFDR